ncbi:hypothetical protein [Mycolicibacterium smegmatis]|uniref:hypothetical protein n=1 Tax=Mycolicibacterium smegmatis TaxID=1772 RepID=UPI001E464781|nr:hypothetical protein [Mycolicibacterium smegmatis]
MTDTPTPRQVLQKLLEGVSAGQWGELAALYAPDTVVEHPLARDHTRMLRGRDTSQPISTASRPRACV